MQWFQQGRKEMMFKIPESKMLYSFLTNQNFLRYLILNNQGGSIELSASVYTTW